MNQLPAYEENCAKLEFITEPRRIAFLKFIIEGYDGLAILSTLDAKQGKVMVRFPECRRLEVINLLNSLKIVL